MHAQARVLPQHYQDREGRHMLIDKTKQINIFACVAPYHNQSVWQIEKLVWKDRLPLWKMKNSLRNLTVSWKRRMRLTLSQPQDQPVSSQLISSLQEKKHGCQKIVKLNGVLAQGMSHPAWLPV